MSLSDLRQELCGGLNTVMGRLGNLPCEAPMQIRSCGLATDNNTRYILVSKSLPSLDLIFTLCILRFYIFLVCVSFISFIYQLGKSYMKKLFDSFFDMSCHIGIIFVLSQLPLSSSTPVSYSFLLSMMPIPMDFMQSLILCVCVCPRSSFFHDTGFFWFLSLSFF